MALTFIPIAEPTILIKQKNLKLNIQFKDNNLSQFRQAHFATICETVLIIVLL